MWINQYHGCLFGIFTIIELGPVGNVHWPAIAHKQIKYQKVWNNNWITLKSILPNCILIYIEFWDVTFLAVSQAVLPDNLTYPIPNMNTDAVIQVTVRDLALTFSVQCDLCLLCDLSPPFPIKESPTLGQWPSFVKTSVWTHLPFNRSCYWNLYWRLY